jgi:hypothetical protein
MSRIITGGASESQIGQAAILRGQTVDPSDRIILNQIVHSADVVGPFANTPNAFRDPTTTFDPQAQAALDAIAAKK